MNAVKKLAVRISCKCREILEYRVARKDMRRLAESGRRSGPVRVVFITQYVPAWNKVKGLYEELRGREGVESYILCVPSGIRDGKLLDGKDLSNDTYAYFVSQGYDAINALVGEDRWFDLQSLQPDYVFHSRPYNGFMPPEYQSHRIRKYARLCNIMYGPAMTYDGLRSTLNWDYHKDLFRYFALTPQEADWWNGRFAAGVKQGLQRACPLGSPVMEELKRCGTGVEEPTHPVVLWSPRWTTDPAAGGSNFFNYRQLLVDFARSHSDTELIVRPHPLMFDHFVSTGEMTAEEVAAYRAQLEQLPNARLDEEKEYTQMLWRTTALVSDISFLMVEYFTTGKPLIFCPAAQNYSLLPWVERMLEGCYTAANAAELSDLLEMLARGEDPRRELRREIIKELFGAADGSAARIADVLVRDDCR